MLKYLRVLSFLALLVFAGCAEPTIYTKPEFSDVTKSHQKVAILPFTVNIDSKNQSKEFTVEMARKAEKDEGYLFQQQIYAQFLKQQSKGRYTVSFQDVEYTNAVLSKGSITYENMSTYKKSDLAKLLEVDAVISGTIKRSKPMSGAGVAVLGILTGFWGATNKVDVSLNVYDGKSDELLWKYDHETSGSIGSSPESLAKSLMKGISKDFPYNLNNSRAVSRSGF
jgi:hypothetical protein